MRLQIQQRNPWLFIFTLLFLIVVFIVGCGNPPPPPPNGDNGNGGNSGTISPSQNTVVYMLPGQTQVALLKLNIAADTNDITGTFTYVYNCGDGTNATSNSLQVTGTAPTPSSVTLYFSGYSSAFTGTTNSDGLYLIAPSGGSEQFQLISPTNTLADAINNLPAISSVSGYSCSNLPPNAGP